MGAENEDHVARLVIYKSPSQGLDRESRLAWEALADRLRSLGHDVSREDEYLGREDDVERGYRGVARGEAVQLYFVTKAHDTVLDPIMETAKVWGRERFSRRRHQPRTGTLSITFRDEKRRLIWSWKVDQDGEQEQTPANNL
jgi:hypothetical protein